MLYKKLGFIDEICLICQFKDESIVIVSILRHVGELPFTKADIKQLKVVFPLMKSILTKWQQNLEQTAAPNLEWQLDNALINFGNSVLTLRESWLLQLLRHYW